MILKPKSVAFYICHGYGTLTAVSKNAVTRLRKKLDKGIKAGETYSMRTHKVKMEGK